MTEDEAKTKWCPFARVGATTTGLGSMNRNAIATDARPSGPMEEARCIGSACMAWRLSTPPKTRQESRGPQGGYRTVVIADGYCGLAGSPQ